MRPSRQPRSLSSGRPEAGPGGGFLRMRNICICRYRYTSCLGAPNGSVSKHAGHRCSIWHSHAPPPRRLCDPLRAPLARPSVRQCRSGAARPHRQMGGHRSCGLGGRRPHLVRALRDVSDAAGDFAAGLAPGAFDAERLARPVTRARLDGGDPVYPHDPRSRYRDDERHGVARPLCRDAARGAAPSRLAGPVARVPGRGR